MKGKNLKTGCTIGIISPASPLEKDEIEKGISFLKDLGYNVLEGDHIYDKYGYLAGRDIDRASDFNNMFKNKDVDMILCIRGGYGVNRILPFIDFGLIKKNPKIFVGFSDITSLLNVIYEKTGLITFHGPMLNSDFDSVSLSSFRESLVCGTKPYVINNVDNSFGEGLKIKSNPGETKGRLLGGNLALIVSLMGTPYDIDFKDNIIFMEDVGEEPYRIDRMLTSLELSGKLLDAAGFVIGQFTNCSLPHYEKSLTLEQVIEDKILSLNKPTIVNFQSGHSYP
ncbi:MAG: LD-carboxypeptidase, partial [Bacillota bacterium]|nr:LD-carboxypeptidase [Bacillota bacterium]